MEAKYDSRWLIQIASVANAIACAEGMSMEGVMKLLLRAVEQGELTSDLYLPHQSWAHSGNMESVGKPIAEGLRVWQSLQKRTTNIHTSKQHRITKADFDLPPAASTYHLLADDVANYAGKCSISPVVAQALREMAIQRKPRLGAVPPVLDVLPEQLPAHDTQATQVAPDTQAAPVVSPSQVLPRKTRRDLLTPLIEAAQRQCQDPTDAAAVWLVLTAQAEKGVKPFLGVTEDGLKWNDPNDNAQFLRLRNLRDRITRKPKKTR